MKCDETPPYCLRCTSTGRKCEGIEARDTTDSQIVFAGSATPLYHFYSREPVKEEEGYCLNHFRNDILSMFAGYGQAPPWKNLMLQLLHEEPSVRHAAIAFSALHKSMQTGRLNEGAVIKLPVSFSLEQYNKCIMALQKLLSRPEKRDLEAALCCSLLCICFEVLEGTHEHALGHLNHSLSVLQSVKSGKSDTSSA